MSSSAKSLETNVIQPLVLIRLVVVPRATRLCSTAMPNFKVQKNYLGLHNYRAYFESLKQGFSTLVR